MQVNISGHHIDLTTSLREYVETKLERLERRYDKITNARVILTLDNQKHKAEAVFMVAGGEIHASAKSDDMYSAIDALADKADRQLVKHKEKTKAKR